MIDANGGSMHATSRDALAVVRESCGALDAAAGLAQGGELFSVVALLDGEHALRRVLADGATEPSARARLISTVLDGKVSAEVLSVVTVAVEQQWSSSADLLDCLELVGQEAMLRSAQEAGQLDAVEDELFRLGRIVAGSPELERTLGPGTADPARTRELVRTLLSGKTTDVTAALADQLIGRQREELVDGLTWLASLAASRREKSVAYVRAAVALSDQQEERLAVSLSRIYRREVTLHVEVDATLTGGLVVQVDDEVIDGSIAGRLNALRGKLAG